MGLPLKSFKQERGNVEGVVVAIHQKTVSVLELDQTKWKISSSVFDSSETTPQKTLSFFRGCFHLPMLRRFEKPLEKDGAYGPYISLFSVYSKSITEGGLFVWHFRHSSS